MGTTNILDLNNRVSALEKSVSGGDSSQANKSDIATVFNTTTNYTAGCFVYHDGKLYQFNADHAAGAWDPTDVVEANVTDQIVSNSNTFKDYTEKSDIAPTFTEANNYNKGDLIYYEGTLYEFNQTHEAGVWNSAHVDVVKLSEILNSSLFKKIRFTQSAENAVTINAGQSATVDLDTWNIPTGYTLVGVVFATSNKENVSLTGFGEHGNVFSFYLRNDTSENVTGCRPIVMAIFIKSQLITLPS